MVDVVEAGRVLRRVLVPAGLGGGGGGPDALLAEVPGVLLELLVPADVRHLVAPLADVEARRPQVVRLDHVGVGVDHLEAVDVGFQHCCPS